MTIWTIHQAVSGDNYLYDEKWEQLARSRNLANLHTNAIQLAYERRLTVKILIKKEEVPT